jgi:hypothetical protein
LGLFEYGEYDKYHALTFYPPPMSPSTIAHPSSASSALQARFVALAQNLQESLSELLSMVNQQATDLAALREQLTKNETSMATMMPSLPPVIAPAAPAPEGSLKALLSAAPSYPQAQAAKVPEPINERAPSGPLMTRILWPSTQLMSPKSEEAPSVVPTAALAPHIDPPLEQATLEELNAALAYAFSQVANTKSIGPHAVTKMIPPPMPTSALRYGTIPEPAH